MQYGTKLNGVMFRQIPRCTQDRSAVDRNNDQRIRISRLLDVETVQHISAAQNRLMDLDRVLNPVCDSSQSAWPRFVSTFAPNGLSRVQSKPGQSGRHDIYTAGVYCSTHCSCSPRRNILSCVLAIAHLLHVCRFYTSSIRNHG